MWSCDQGLVTIAFLWEKLSQHQFYKDLTRKKTFFKGCSWKKGSLETLHQFGKRVKAKSQKVLGANSYVCRNYRGKTGRVAFSPPSPILNRVKNDETITSSFQNLDKISYKNMQSNGDSISFGLLWILKYFWNALSKSVDNLDLYKLYKT